MRKTILITLLLIVGVMLFAQGTAQSAPNQNIITDVMNVGDDYTYSWGAGSYNAWDYTGLSSGSATSSGSMYGGWDWAAQFVAPCPQWLKRNSNGDPDYKNGKCNWDATVHTDYTMSSNPQTKWGLDSEVDGTIVDDLYARVVDHWRATYTGSSGASDASNKGILDQDLDILFARYSDPVSGQKHLIYTTGVEGLNAHTTDTYIDQAIDQQFAYWEDSGGVDSMVINAGTENGITQRLINDFAYALISTYYSANDSVEVDNTHLQEAPKIDQWVVQWLRDIDTKSYTAGEGYGKEGIDQYFSSWFKDDDDPTYTGPSSHTYGLDHTVVPAKVEKGGHDHDPNDGTTYKNNSGGTVWDP